MSVLSWLLITFINRQFRWPGVVLPGQMFSVITHHPINKRVFGGYFVMILPERV